jgi:hypothetical protein
VNSLHDVAHRCCARLSLGNAGVSPLDALMREVFVVAQRLQRV